MNAHRPREFRGIRPLQAASRLGGAEAHSLDLHMSPDGIRNLAPFSFFTVASRKPSVPGCKYPPNALVTL